MLHHGMTWTWDAKPKSKTCFLLSRIPGPKVAPASAAESHVPCSNRHPSRERQNQHFPASVCPGDFQLQHKASDASSIHLVAPLISKKLGVAFALTLQQSTHHVTHIPPPPPAPHHALQRTLPFSFHPLAATSQLFTVSMPNRASQLPCYLGPEATLDPGPCQKGQR